MTEDGTGRDSPFWIRTVVINLRARDSQKALTVRQLSGARFLLPATNQMSQISQENAYIFRITHIDNVPWILKARDFTRDPDDPCKLERYMAEALIHRHVPMSTLLGIACYCPNSASRLLDMQGHAGVSLKAVAKPEWYFR